VWGDPPTSASEFRSRKTPANSQVLQNLKGNLSNSKFSLQQLSQGHHHHLLLLLTTDSGQMGTSFNSPLLLQTRIFQGYSSIPTRYFTCSRRRGGGGEEEEEQ
jgi:hypothetical protein